MGSGNECLVLSMEFIKVQLVTVKRLECFFIHSNISIHFFLISAALVPIHRRTLSILACGFAKLPAAFVNSEYSNIFNCA